MLFQRNFYLKCLVYLSWNILWSEAFNRFNISLEKLRDCREYTVAGEYGYHDFFHMKSLNHTKLGPDETLHLKLFVSTDSDAHVLLSVNSEPFLSANRDYEFVIGGWVNTRTVLRQKYKNSAEIAVNENDKHLLNLFDLTPIEIIQTRHGQISLYVPGLKAEPVISYYDPVPFDLNYLSFSTYAGHRGRWLYDCDLEDPEEDKLETDKVLSNQEEHSMHLSKNEKPVRLEKASVQFNVDVLTTENSPSIMKGQLHFQLNFTGSEIVLSNNTKIDTECLKNTTNCPVDAFQCKISDVQIKPIHDDANELFDIRIGESPTKATETPNHRAVQ